MQVIALWLGLVAVGIDSGYEPAVDGHLEYIVQIEPQLLATLARGNDITSEIPTGLDIRHFRITVGTAKLPRQVGTGSANAGSTGASLASIARRPLQPAGVETPDVRSGYQPSDGEYVIEIPPSELHDLDNQDLTVDVPAAAQVTRLRVSTQPGSAPPPNLLADDASPQPNLLPSGDDGMSAIQTQAAEPLGQLSEREQAALDQPTAAARPLPAAGGAGTPDVDQLAQFNGQSAQPFTGKSAPAAGGQFPPASGQSAQAAARRADQLLSQSQSAGQGGAPPAASADQQLQDLSALEQSELSHPGEADDTPPTNWVPDPAVATPIATPPAGPIFNSTNPGGSSAAGAAGAQSGRGQGQLNQNQFGGQNPNQGQPFGQGQNYLQQPAGGGRNSQWSQGADGAGFGNTAGGQQSFSQPEYAGGSPTGRSQRPTTRNVSALSKAEAYREKVNEEITEVEKEAVQYKDKPWLVLTFVLLLLFVSIGANVYLCWVAWDARYRSQLLLERLHDTSELEKAA